MAVTGASIITLAFFTQGVSLLYLPLMFIDNDDGTEN